MRVAAGRLGEMVTNLEAKEMDTQTLAWIATLPEIGDASPPPLCPICSAQQIPPEIDEGIPPPERWQYYCNASYDAEDEENLRDWKPGLWCWKVSERQVAAWVRDGLAEDPRCIGAAAELRQVVFEPPPYPAAPGAVDRPVAVPLPRIEGSVPPGACPICGAAAKPGDSSKELVFVHYDCDSIYSVSSKRPTGGGRFEPTSFAGHLGPCPRASHALLLRMLAEKSEDPALRERSAAALETLRTQIASPRSTEPQG